MTDNLNLGRPLNEGSHTQGSVLNASGNPGDYNGASGDQGFAREVLDSLNGGGRSAAQPQQHSTAGQYATTNPASGFQTTGEAEPHAGHPLHSGSHAHAHFPNESDTLTSGEAGKFGTENDARRQEGLVGAATGHTSHSQSHSHQQSGLTGGHTGASLRLRSSSLALDADSGAPPPPAGPTTREFNEELTDPSRGQPDLVGHTVGTGYGLNKGHLGGDQTATTTTSSALGQTGGETGASSGLGGAGLGAAGVGAGVAGNSILNSSEQPKELTIGGFNPKTGASGSPSPPALSLLSRR